MSANDNERMILEMVAQGKITQDQADQLLAALEDEDPAPQEEPQAPLDGESQEDGESQLVIKSEEGETVTISPQEIRVEKVGSEGKTVTISSGGVLQVDNVGGDGGSQRSVTLTLHPDGETVDFPASLVEGLEEGETFRLNVNPPAPPTPPTPPAPPTPPTPPTPPAPPTPPESNDPEALEEYRERMEQVQERYREIMEEYQQQVEELNEAYQDQMEEYQEQVEELNEAYQEQMEEYQEQMEEREQARREAAREARRAQRRGNPGPGYWPLTDEEYNRAYNEAYNQVYNPAYEKLYNKFGPGTEGFREEVEKIAREAQQAAQAAVEKARSEKSAAQPQSWKQSTGGWSAWLNNLGREISQAMNGIGAEIGIDLNEAMSDVSDIVNDMKDSLQEMVEDWKEEQEEEDPDGDEDSGFPFDTSSPVENAAQRTGDGEYKYTSCVGMRAIERLNVNWFTGAVNVCPWEGDYVEVNEYCKKPLDPDQRMKMMVSDAARLTVEWGKKKSGLNLFGGRQKRLEIRVPQSLCEKIEKLKINCISASIRAQGLRCEQADLSTTSGSISAQGLTGEDLALHSVSGSVKAQGLTAEKLDLNTVSGSIQAQGISAEKLNLNTASGSLKAEGFSAEEAALHTVSGSLKAHGNAEAFKVGTTSGSMELTVDQCPEKAKLSSVSGSLSLTLPENEGFTAVYNTVSGGFRTDFPVSGTSGGKKGQVVYGTGETWLEFSTTSGSMSVKRA